MIKEFSTTGANREADEDTGYARQIRPTYDRGICEELWGHGSKPVPPEQASDVMSILGILSIGSYGTGPLPLQLKDKETRSRSPLQL